MPKFLWGINISGIIKSQQNNLPKVYLILVFW